MYFFVANAYVLRLNWITAGSYPPLTFHEMVAIKYLHMGQSFQEWTKQNLWKTAFKRFEGVWSTLRFHTPSHFLKVVFHKFYLVHSWILCPLYSTSLQTFCYKSHLRPFGSSYWITCKVVLGLQQFSWWWISYP